MKPVIVFLSILLLTPSISFSSTELTKIDREKLHHEFKIPAAKLPLEAIKPLPREEAIIKVEQYATKYIGEVQELYTAHIKAPILFLNTEDNQKKFQTLIHDLLKNEAPIDESLNEQITSIGKQAIKVIYETNMHPNHSLVSDMAEEVINLKTQLGALEKTNATSKEDVLSTSRPEPTPMLLYVILGISSLSVLISLLQYSKQKNPTKKKA